MDKKLLKQLEEQLPYKNFDAIVVKSAYLRYKKSLKELGKEDKIFPIKGEEGYE